MTYPTNGTQFLGLNISCSFLGTANITLFPGSTGKTATATLYLDGIFYGNQTVAPSISGLYNFNFTGLTQSGIYNMSVVVSDSYGTSNSSAWATMGAMGSCPAVTTPAIVSGGKPTNMTIIIMPVIFFGVLLAVFGYPLLKKKETPTFEKFEKKRQKVEEWKGKKKSEETGEEEKEE